MKIFKIALIIVVIFFTSSTFFADGKEAAIGQRIELYPREGEAVAVKKTNGYVIRATRTSMSPYYENFNALKDSFRISSLGVSRGAYYFYVFVEDSSGQLFNVWSGNRRSFHLLAAPFAGVSDGAAADAYVIDEASIKKASKNPRFKK